MGCPPNLFFLSNGGGSAEGEASLAGGRGAFGEGEGGGSPIPGVWGCPPDLFFLPNGGGSAEGEASLPGVRGAFGEGEGGGSPIPGVWGVLQNSSSFQMEVEVQRAKPL